jgi:multidrug efflux pump subunit AcrA (membrane-fusion protein)
MSKRLFKTTLFLFIITSLVACGDKSSQDPLPRLVKVVIAGQTGEAAITASSVKNPDALTFDASGKVLEISVSKGQKVIAGQALARVMPTSMSMAESSALTSYRAAKAELQSAEGDFRRYSDLREKNFISASEFERRVAVIEGAKAKYEQSLDQLGFVTLRSPEQGVVGDIKLQLGQTISAMDVVARVIVASKPVMQKKATQTQIYLPTTAIHSDGVSVYKLKLDSGSDSIGVLEVVQLKLGQADESSVPVLSGLVNGDIVIATGWHALNAGQKVRIALKDKAN